MKILLAVITLTLSMPALAFEKLSGTLYEMNSVREKVLYKYNRQNEEANGQTLKSHISFVDPDGKEAIHEEVIYENGIVKNYRMEQKQTNEWGTIEIKDGRVYFTYSKGGKVTKDDEKATDNFIIGPTITSFIMKHWDQILKGDTIDARFGVLDRKETVGFKYFKVDEKKVNGQDAVVVKMKPTSFVIAALVAPLLFTIDKSGTKLIELKGRTLPKRLVDGKWKDLDVETVYSY